MRALTPIILFFTLLSFGQEVKDQEYYDNGQKIIKKTWQDGEQTKTLVQTVSEQGSEYYYFINENGVEVGVNFYAIRDYGRYFKVEVSIINNSNNRYEFTPKNIIVSVNGKINDKSRYYAIPYSEYNKKVIRKQKGNQFLLGLAQGLENASAGLTYSQSDSYYSGTYGSGYMVTNTTSYSPSLASMQYRQNTEDMASLQNEQQERLNVINQGYLKNHTLFPNTQLEGYFFIPFSKKITDIDMLLKIGDMIFDFRNDKWHY